MGQVETVEPSPGIAAGDPMPRYVVALFVGGLLFTALLAAIFMVLDRRGALPPPQISNSLCLDLKLAFMRDNPPRDPNLLVTGSSVAWRHFNSPHAVRHDPHLRPFNAAFCGTSMAQTEKVTAWLVGRLPSVERVLMIISPVDFEGCATNAHSTFDVRETERFVFGGAPKIGFYLKYFDAETLVGNAIGLQRNRLDMTSFQGLLINQFGDGPLEPKQSRGLHYGAAQLDDQCFAALRRIARVLSARDVQLTVMATPVHPEWRRQFDPSGEILETMRRKIEQALGGTTAAFVEDRSRYPAAAFFDAYHLRWSSTPRLTRSALTLLERQR